MRNNEADPGAPAVDGAAPARSGTVQAVERAVDLLEAMADETGVRDYTSLYSTREYKKTRVRYFTPEMEAWERLYAGALRS